MPNVKKRVVPEKERAIVLQGGGSLGAYEAGAYRGLCEFLTNVDKERGEGGRPIFDIVAGTSIGAINAAILVSYVVENHTYEGSADKLVDFWNYLSKESMVETIPFFRPWWDYWHAVNNDIASGEAARRYYSAQEFAVYGIPTVFYPHRPDYDKKFFSSANTWYRFSNDPLRRSLERFAKFPIATAQEEGQPRLILTAVDVAEGLPVTFDSYPKEDGRRKTEYGRFIREDDKEIGFEHVIQYDGGITADHVMASGSFPVNFDFAKMQVRSYDSSNRINDIPYKKELRYFWDGGLMTNTPLMQLVLLHRMYWYRVKGLKDTVPRLGICVTNLHPTKQPEIPADRDGIMNRKEDISFSDRTQQQEEGILFLISDYIDLARGLVKIAKDHGVKDDIIKNLLDHETKYHGMLSRIRHLRDMLEGRFQIDEIIRIDRKNDEHTISNKIFDFSSGTIKLLLEQGYNDSYTSSIITYETPQ
jgi:NTE family protein